MIVYDLVTHFSAKKKRMGGHLGFFFSPLRISKLRSAGKIKHV